MVAGRALEISALTQNDFFFRKVYMSKVFCKHFSKPVFGKFVWCKNYIDKKTVVAMYSETSIQMEINPGKHDLNQALTKYLEKISPHAQRISWHE